MSNYADEDDDGYEDLSYLVPEKLEETTKDWGPFFRSELPTAPPDDEHRQGRRRQPLISTAWAGETQPPWRCGRGVAIRRGNRTILYGIWYRRKKSAGARPIDIGTEAKTISRW